MNNNFKNQISQMEQMLQGQLKKLEEMNSSKEVKEYSAVAGDDGIDVTIVCDGSLNIKSITIGEELKSCIASDCSVYLNVLIDLIIAAFNKVKEQVDEETGGAAGDLMDFENLIPSDMKNLLGNLGNLFKK